MTRDDIASFGFYERFVGPYFVRLKFVCAKCQAEKLYIMRQEQWEEQFDLARPIVMRMMRVKPATQD